LSEQNKKTISLEHRPRLARRRTSSPHTGPFRPRTPRGAALNAAPWTAIPRMTDCPLDFAVTRERPHRLPALLRLAMAASAQVRRPKWHAISPRQDCPRLPNRILAAVHNYICLGEPWGARRTFTFLRTPAIRVTSAIEILSGPGSAPPALARALRIVHVDSQRPRCVRKHRPRDVYVSARVSCACKMARAREDPAVGDLAHGWPGFVAPLRNEGRSVVAVLFAIVRIAQRDCLVSAQGEQSPRPHRHPPPIRAACSTDTETPAASATGVLIRSSAHLSLEPSEMAPRMYPFTNSSRRTGQLLLSRQAISESRLPQEITEGRGKWDIVGICNCWQAPAQVKARLFSPNPDYS
jgi:hypothetical protein